MNARFINEVPKVWGKEQWVCNEAEYCCKLLTLNPDFQSSLHVHAIKKETFIVQRGFCKLQVNDDKGNPWMFELHEGDLKHILPGTPHRFSNEGYSPCVILEVSTHHSDEDCARIEESGKLPSTSSAYSTLRSESGTSI